MRLGNREITLGEHYTISIENGNVVSIPGRNAIRRLLREETMLERSLPENWNWSLNVPNLPKLTTRIGKFYADHYKLSLDPQVISRIGNIVQQYAQTKADDYYIDFVNEFNWRAGAFGESTESCFWNGRGFARKLMQLNGGIAVRFWRDAEYVSGYARAWIAPQTPGDSLFIIYNGYGMDQEARYGSTRPIASLLSTWMNLDLKEITLDNEGEDDGTLYINSNSGFLIGETAAIDRWDDYDLHYVDPSVSCSGCGHRYDRDECVHYENSYSGAERWYCPDCAERYVGTCSHCNGVLDSNDAHRIGAGFPWGHSDYRGVCPQCIQLFAACDHCHHYHLRTEMVAARITSGFGGTRDVLVCLGCSARYATCGTCNTRFVRRNSETRCERCERERQWQLAEQARRQARQEAARTGADYANSGPPVYQTVYADPTFNMTVDNATVSADRIRFNTTNEPDGTIVIRATVES
jgi:hypothetical protein